MPGIHLIGSSRANLEQALLSAGVSIVIWVLRRNVRLGLKLRPPGEGRRAIIARFWAHQVINAGAPVVGVFTPATDALWLVRE